MNFEDTPSHAAYVASKLALKVEKAANGKTPLAAKLCLDTAKLLKSCGREAGYI